MTAIPTDPPADPPPPPPPDDDEGETGPIGIFPSWPWLYVSVVVYTAALIGILYWFTVTLDHGLVLP